MKKQSKYPVYVVSHNNGTITKCKSVNELNLYRTKVNFYTEFSTYPSVEQVKELLVQVGGGK
jgi:hypothetical protein